MSLAFFISRAVLGAYFLGGLALWFYVESIRHKTEPPQTLPRPLAFIGPSAWGYAFSGRHRGANDRVLT